MAIDPRTFAEAELVRLEAEKADVEARRGRCESAVDVFTDDLDGLDIRIDAMQLYIASLPPA